MTNIEPSKEKLRQTVEVFWESFPPFWHRIRAHIRQAAEQYDISVEQFHILRHIRRGICSVSELAEAKTISRPAVSQAVEALVQKGLIERSPGDRDRRFIQLALTESGNNLLDSVIDSTRQWMVELLEPLNEDELDWLIRGMDALKKIKQI
ncbi:MAG: MarR family transcriptional regulator [Chloroflexi bacterium]|nr:MAG: MarR family transcriptional regulator [Chloroflexota bacterium]